MANSRFITAWPAWCPPSRVPKNKAHSSQPSAFIPAAQSGMKADILHDDSFFSGSRTLILSDPMKLGYRPSLDGLRAIAVLVVMAHHGGIPGFEGGGIGVDIFFVLSGFLITSLLFEEWSRRRNINLRAF